MSDRRVTPAASPRRLRVGSAASPRRLRVAVALCATTVAAGMTGGSARAADAGAIEGVVVNRATGRPAEGVRVRLAGGGGGAGQVTRDRVTDERGRFEFRGLPTGADRFYAIDARHDGGLFAGGVVQLPANTEEPPVVDTRLSVWPTTTDPEHCRGPRHAVRGPQR
jgi:hypothetical protein